MEITAGGNAPPNSGMSGNNESILNKASSGAHAAVNSLANAADGAVCKAKPTIDRIATMAHQAVDKAAGAAAPTADWLAEQGESLNATKKKLVANSCSYVSANPLKAVGIALVAGILLSRIIIK